jgi:hypothetical protein
VLLAPPPGYVVTLPAGRVDGHAVLGASIARIEARLGRPLRASGCARAGATAATHTGASARSFGAHGTRRVIYGVERMRPYLGVQIWPNP